MSYMEIYNEKINDLLAPEHRKLQIHENLERGIFVAGLREEIVASPEQVLEFMENLVDLAGLERAAKTGAEGVHLKEGHVSYRDSKLTRILQPALGGNANTAIICNITLAQIHADETKSCLQFASRALRVTNCACVNEILTDAALLKRQKKEIEELKGSFKKSELLLNILHNVVLMLRLKEQLDFVAPAVDTPCARQQCVDAELVEEVVGCHADAYPTDASIDKLLS
ncbi:hypothetical protein RHGRI_005143 [Rhododendron griersonianum]|uniref:Kinesin motor domain-containing protein n=1 Tax=Rhododendron griersonianum TaxID=479676 RepID=A0AAV6LDM2_9ERIC|nr:hypothetical protein RHGRI_005143 [Rhododendron griersonianum]